jgi:serine/threonine protein kinase
VGTILTSESFLKKCENLDFPNVKHIQVVEGFDHLRDRTTSYFETFYNGLEFTRKTRYFQSTLQERCRFLDESEVKEISAVFFFMLGKEPVDEPVRIRKGIDGSSFGYLIKENSFCVFTGREINEGSYKKIHLVLSIDLSGEIYKCSNAKIKPLKRSPERIWRVLHEHEIRSKVHSEFVLDPGMMYAYRGKRGKVKFSWILPHYDMDGIKLISIRKRTYLEQILESKQNAINLFDFMQKMALGVKALHDSGILHRDIKPENFLVKFDFTRLSILEVVLGDLEFSIEEESLQMELDEKKESILTKHFKRSLATVSATNPLFRSLLKGEDRTEFPLTSEYRRAIVTCESKDPDEERIMNMLDAFDAKMFLGTFRYAAPEILATRTYSKKTDIYALGKSFGFARDRLDDIYDVGFAGRIPADIYQLLPGVRGGLNQLIVEMTAEDPSLRPEIDDVIRRISEIYRLQFSN